MTRESITAEMAPTWKITQDAPVSIPFHTGFHYVMHKRNGRSGNT